LQLTSVDQAIKLGAVGVGYTIYVGSEHEEEMMVEFRRICDEAHAKNLIVIVWMYPRGSHVEGKENTKDVVAYAARIALELGADFAKLPYTGDSESFAWVVKSAAATKVLVQGGSKKEEMELLKEVGEFMSVGASGLAIGRNVWQSTDPVSMSQKLAKLVF
jgi:class I fructose-bisphosphate aldolase